MELYTGIYILAIVGTILGYYLLENNYKRKIKKLHLQFIEEERLMKQKIKELKGELKLNE